MRTERFDLLCKEQVVELVLADVFLANGSESLFKDLVGDEVLLDLRVGLEGLVHAVLLTLVEVLRHFGSLVHMRLKVCGLCQLEHVRVERGHLRPDVVEQVGLLHVVALNAHWDFLVQIFLSQAQLQQLLLVDHELDGAVRRAEGIQGPLRETVCFQSVQAVIRL